MSLLNKPMRRPVPLACTTTLMAGVFLAAGVSGFTMNKHDAFVAGTPWSGAVIWPQVFVGLALLAVSAWLWVRAVRWLRT